MWLFKRMALVSDTSADFDWNFVSPFGVMFGITTVKNEDMSPRMSAGDLVLYYRLDKHPVAGDVIVYKKTISSTWDELSRKGAIR